MKELLIVTGFSFNDFRVKEYLDSIADFEERIQPEKMGREMPFTGRSEQETLLGWAQCIKHMRETIALLTRK